MIKFKKFSELTESYHKVKGGAQEKIDEAKLEQLKQIKTIMAKHGAQWFLDCGTLLGAVREKGFIKNDSDSDIGIRAKYVSEALLTDLKDAFIVSRQGGNKDDFLTFGFTSKTEDGKKLVIEGTHIFCDLNVYYEIEDRQVYSLRLEGKKGPFYYLKKETVNSGIKMYDLKGVKLPVLKNHLAQLDEMYDNWKTPNRSKTAYPNRCTTWVGKTTSLIYNRADDKCTCNWPKDFDWKNWEGK